MAEGADDEDGDGGGRKGGKKGLLIGLVLAVLGAGGGFAFSSGMLGGGKSDDSHAAAESHGGDDGHGDDGHADAKSSGVAGTTFLPVDPIMISFGPAGARQHLRVQLRLEAPVDMAGEIEGVMPRITDVLNGYLRAVDPVMLEDPAMLTKLRAQMLRRVQIVAGDGAVADLLVMEFVLS